jgi:hypothetical protein
MIELRIMNTNTTFKIYYSNRKSQHFGTISKLDVIFDKKMKNGSIVAHFSQNALHNNRFQSKNYSNLEDLSNDLIKIFGNDILFE